MTTPVSIIATSLTTILPIQMRLVRQDFSVDLIYKRLDDIKSPKASSKSRIVIDEERANDEKEIDNKKRFDYRKACNDRRDYVSASSFCDILN